MSEKGERNQVQQPSKAEKGYGGYLPSVEQKGRTTSPKGEPRPAEKTLDHPS